MDVTTSNHVPDMDGPETAQSADILTEALKKQPFDEAVKGLGIDAIRTMLFEKYNFLYNGYQNITEQLNKVANKASEDNLALTQRVEKLLSLMSNHMIFIRQMVELLDDYGGRLNGVEKDSNKYKTECMLIVERMNRMTDNYTKFETNTKTIFEEIEKLKVRQDASEKFRWKLTILATISTSIIAWLLIGDNFAKLVNAIQYFYQH